LLALGLVVEIHHLALAARVAIDADGDPLPAMLVRVTQPLDVLRRRLEGG
jgi:hypothetical protein